MVVKAARHCTSYFQHLNATHLRAEYFVDVLKMRAERGPPKDAFSRSQVHITPTDNTLLVLMNCTVPLSFFYLGMICFKSLHEFTSHEETLFWQLSSCWGGVDRLDLLLASSTLC